MASDKIKFELTPTLIDLGYRVVATSHVVSAGRSSGNPFRTAGIAVLLAALALIGYELAMNGGLAALAGGGSTRMWLALLVAGLGIFGIVYQRRALVIALSDGSKILLGASREDFIRQVVARIGEVMSSDRSAPLRFAVDMSAETIVLLSAGEWGGASQTAPSAGGGISISPAQSQQLPAQPSLSPRAQPRESVGPAQHERTGPAPGRDWTGPPTGHDRTGPPPFRNGHGHASSGSTPADSLEARISAVPEWSPRQAGGSPPTLAPPQTGPSPGHHFSGTAAPHYANGPPTGGGLTRPAPPYVNGTPSPVAQPPPSPKRELDALIALVVRSEIQHKPALLDLLKVVDDFMKGGPTDREDAVAHWQSFAGYVEQYLSDVDGLLAMTKRVSRNFGDGAPP